MIGGVGIPEERVVEKGFTLVELMVTLLISAVLLLAMYQNFEVTQRSYLLLEGYSQLQENARFAEDALARTIRVAGYRGNPAFNIAWSFQSDITVAAPTTNAFPSAGQIVTGGNNDAAAGNVILDGTDTVSVRFLGNGQLSDCFGNVITNTDMSVNTFYLATDNSLHCSQTNYDSAGTVTSTLDQPLVNGVENMQVLYGIDSNGDLVPETYLNAAAAAGNWPNVVSVRIAVLYRTSNMVPNLKTQSFVLLDNGVSTFTDGFRRQLFTATINLRNKSL